MEGGELGKPASEDLWRELRSLLAVGLAGSFNAAAQNGMGSHQTFKRRLDGLEARLGLTLAHRSAAGIDLTKAGEELFALAGRFDSDFAQTVLRLKNQERPTGRVRVACTEALLSYWLAPNLSHFHRSKPETELEFVTANDWLHSHESAVDIQVIPASLPEDHPNRCCVRLGTLHLTTFCSREYLRRQGPVDLANLQGQRLVKNDAYDCFTEPGWQAWRRLLERKRPGVSTSGNHAYYNLIKGNMGIGLLASYAALDPDLVPVDLGVYLTQPIYAAFASTAREEPATAATLDWLRGIFSPAHNDWFGEALYLGADHTAQQAHASLSYTNAPPEPRSADFSKIPGSSQ